MSDRQQNLQDTFLNACRKNKAPLTIFLVNGVKPFLLLLGHSKSGVKTGASDLFCGTGVRFEQGCLWFVDGGCDERAEYVETVEAISLLSSEGK